MPLMYDTRAKAVGVFSAVLRDSRKPGNSLPWRSLGIYNHTVPIRLCQASSR